MDNDKLDPGSQVTRDVLSQFERIREEGKCNMFDAACIKRRASEWGFTALVQFIYENPSKWRPLIVATYEAYDPTLNNLFGSEGAEGRTGNG